MSEKRKKNKDITSLPLYKINIGEWNVRTLDKEKGIDELAESILKYGLLQPIVVRKKNDKFYLIIGQRRFRAFKKLKERGITKFNEIPTIILPENIDEESLKILSLSENIHRVELNRADIVEIISFLYEKYNKSAKKIAQILAKSIDYVYEYLKIKNAPSEVMEMLSKREITKEDVKRVMELSEGNKDRMINLAKEMKKLTPFARKRLYEDGKSNPNIPIKDLVKSAEKPRIEEKIIVPLTPLLIRALDTAVKDIGLTREEIAKKAIEEWLDNKGYCKK